MPSSTTTARSASRLAELLHLHRPGDYRIRPRTEAVVVFLALMAATFITVTFIYFRALDAQKQEIRQGLLRTANVLATLVDTDAHGRWTDPSLEVDPEFVAQEQRLIRARLADPQIAFLYTAILDGGTVRFVLDATPPPAAGEEDTRTALLQAYDDAPEDILRALRERTTVVSEEPYTDQWGTFVSGFVPLVDAQGRFQGVLGIDLDVSDYVERLEPIRRATNRALVTAFFIAFLTASAVWFLRRFILVLHRRRNALYDDLQALAGTSGEEPRV